VKPALIKAQATQYCRGGAAFWLSRESFKMALETKNAVGVHVTNLRVLYLLFID